MGLNSAFKGLIHCTICINNKCFYLLLLSFPYDSYKMAIISPYSLRVFLLPYHLRGVRTETLYVQDYSGRKEDVWKEK